MSEAFEETIAPTKPKTPLSLSQKRLNGDIFRLALPAAAENMLIAVMLLVDIFMVGQYAGSMGVAAVGFGSALSFVVMVLFLPLAISTSALVARYFGAGKIEQARRVSAQALLIAGGAGAVLSVLLALLTPDIMKAMGLKGDVYKYGVIYLTWVFGSFVFRLLFLNAGAAIKGAGNTKTPMIIGGFSSILNILLDYLLIFGKLGFPQMGIRGAGVATAISICLGGLLMTGALFTKYSVIRMKLRDFSTWSWGIFRTLSRTTLPSMAEQALTQVGVIAFFRVVSELGDDAIAAHIIATRVEDFSILPGFGFGIAAATLVGQGLGARKIRYAVMSIKRCATYGCLLMGVIGVLIFAFRYSLPQVFRPSPGVLSLSANCLVVAAASQVPLAMGLILLGGLRGAGYTMGAMIVALVGVVLVRLPLAYLLGLYWGLGLVSVWLAVVADWVVRLVVVIFLLRRGRWLRVRV